MRIINGNCLSELDKLEENSVDCIITDPPYELNFMGKGWDRSGVSFNPETWNKCLRVLKDGGYLLAFGGSRTFHRIACAIEDGGFEIRDVVLWLYGCGFPKSMNIGLAVDKKMGVDNTTGTMVRGKVNTGSGRYNWNDPKHEGERIDYPERKATNEWAGWGTCLKPAYEPVIVARKPFKGTCVDNVLNNRVGGLNIDECRIELGDGEIKEKGVGFGESKISEGYGMRKPLVTEKTTEGRFPANVIVDSREGEEWRRYFYCAKATKKDRDEGLEDFQEKSVYERTNVGEGKNVAGGYAGASGSARNFHPTVKPTTLMQYLIRLVAPKGAVILDPFMGSGSTGKAVMYENKERNANYDFIGIEMNPEYCEIAKARINYAKNNG